jgi:alanine racemase
MSNNPTVLEIDTAAILHNFKYFKSKIKKNTKLLVVIKAFGYGSDSIAIGKILEKEKVDYLAVVYTDEGVTLRKAGIKAPILVLHPQIENFETLIHHNLEPNLYNFRSLHAFLKIAQHKNLKNYPVHIKLNTGMNRLGFNESDLQNLTEIIRNDSSIKIISFYSHLAASEDPSEKEFTKNQITLFEKMCHFLSDSLDYSPLKHITNTSGILNYPEAQFDMVRLGIGFYGFGNNPLETKQLKNVCTLKTKISQIQFLKKGDTVGYNRAFIVERPSKIAIIPIGYADGLNRNLGKSKGSVYINNQKVPIIGNICMDICLLDVTEIPCEEGDEVVVFNRQNHILDYAKITTTIPYEILTSISQRVHRRII